MSKKIKVGIAGVRGLSTLMGLRAIEDVEITAMCDLDEAHLNDAAAKIGCEKKYRVFDDMLESDIDAVIIATPMQCHVPQAIAAMEAGKHVLSEVTAGVTMDELWWLIESKEKYGVTYMMAENYIYTPEVQLMKSLRESGQFGTPFYAEGQYLHDVTDLAVYPEGKRSWRSFWQLGKRGNFYPTHSMGPVMQFFGDDVHATEISCFGTGGQFVKPELRQDELTMTMVRMSNGGLAKIGVACKAPRPHNMTAYLFQGTKGCMEMPRGLGDTPSIWLEDHPKDPESTRREWRSLYDFNDYLPERYKASDDSAKNAGHGGGDFYQVYDFVDAIRTGEEPEVNVYRAAEWTAVGLLSELSVVNGGRAISVPNFRKNMPSTEKKITL